MGFTPGLEKLNDGEGSKLNCEEGLKVNGGVAIIN
tara:strand:+ start:2235 stop:2339 length:105 start_codon:yes stop_codon:yes gene_type:complete